MVFQALQLAASLLILTAFALLQRGRWDQRSRPYLWLNFAGSLVLAVEAAMGRQWGFLLLEGSWAAISLTSLVGVLRGRPPEGPAAA